MNSKLFLIVFLFLITVVSYSQRFAEIKNVDFSLIENSLVITYDINKYSQGDKFNIKPEIYKASGQKIQALSFSGDLKLVSGGSNKKIFWDLEKDKIILDDDIYIELTGEIISDQVDSNPVETKTVIQAPVINKQKELKTINRTACFFESLAFPGWGTSNLTLKKGHLVKGFVGYGAVIGSIVMAKKASNTYDVYRKSNTAAERDKYFEQAKSENTASMILAGCAGIVWSVDLVSVLALKEKRPKSLGYLNANISYSMDHVNSHLFTFSLIF